MMSRVRFDKNDIVSLRLARLTGLSLLVTASAFAGSCAGTVTSMMASPCNFGVATLQITNFSDTFGISADQTDVKIVNYGTTSNPFYFLDIQPQSGSFGEYNSGLGTATVQLQVVFPTAPPGSEYGMYFYVVNGCCEIGGEGLHSLTAGTVEESITASTLEIIQEQNPLYFDALEQVSASYTTDSGISDSTYYSGITSGPISFFEFSEPTSQAIMPLPTPEPLPFGLIGISAPVLFAWRRLLKR